MEILKQFYQNSNIIKLYLLSEYTNLIQLMSKFEREWKKIKFQYIYVQLPEAKPRNLTYPATLAHGRATIFSFFEFLCAGHQNYHKLVKIRWG